MYSIFKIYFLSNVNNYRIIYIYICKKITIYVFQNNQLFKKKNVFDKYNANNCWVYFT
jgi:hypothetical protein